MITIFLSFAILIIIFAFINHLVKVFDEYGSIKNLITYAEINKPGARKSLGILIIGGIALIVAIIGLIFQ